MRITGIYLPMGGKTSLCFRLDEAGATVELPSGNTVSLSFKGAHRSAQAFEAAEIFENDAEGRLLLIQGRDAKRHSFSITFYKNRKPRKTGMVHLDYDNLDEQDEFEPLDDEDGGAEPVVQLIVLVPRSTAPCACPRCLELYPIWMRN